MKSYQTIFLILVLSALFGEFVLGQTTGLRPSAAAYLIRKLPDTGQSTSYTTTFGEDADYLINPPSFTQNVNGTVTDNVTGLMWQQVDGGEMTIERASIYCDTLTLGSFTDWRLPTAHELYGLVNLDKLNPALDTSVFKKTAAEYWWSSDRQATDTARVWVVNGGGGIGPHPKSETVSAGGAKYFHVRAVRVANASATTSVKYQANGDSTVTDLATGLVWQKFQTAGTFTWEQALGYAESLNVAGKSDWRLPNVKELQSINDVAITNPSVDRSFFPAFTAGKAWSSTTQFNGTTKAWSVDFVLGIVSYDLKTSALKVLCVRGGTTPVPPATTDSLGEVTIPTGEFQMGDHFGFVDPSHPSDELPLHLVKVNSFIMSQTETTNKQACDLLNYAIGQGLIEVRGNCVFLTGGADTLLYLNAYATYASIGWDGTTFSIVDSRASHPLVGVMWNGAAALCNWNSLQRGLTPAYNLTTWTCDFTRDGYRLPTEAEWEWAGRGGQIAPYYNYPWGNDQDVTKANWPASGDPYESGSIPYTTPAGFYNGSLRLKAAYNWPGAATSYQTTSGANAFGLYDMAGNVWELLNDWYGNNYYSVSPYDNPKGPTSGFIMPDGKPYHGMRGGNWYNGYSTTSVNDGHSRVSNRNPSYYRGPQDPNHPWYHVGFRFARNYVSSTDVHDASSSIPTECELLQNYPNPFNPSTSIEYRISSTQRVRLSVFDVLGREVAVMVDGVQTAGNHQVTYNAASFCSGLYFYRLTGEHFSFTKKMVLSK